MSPKRSIWSFIVFAASWICLSGFAAAAPQLQLSRTTIDFGLIGSGVRSSAQPVFVMNTGDAPLVLSAIGLSGAQASDFHVDTTCIPPVTLPPGARCRLDMTVQLASTNPLTRVAALIIESDALAPTNIALRATYESDISSGFVPAPAFVDFIDVPVGSSATATLVVTNPEPGVAVIESVAPAQGDVQDFSVSSNCVGTSGNGSTCASTIVFAPTSPGPRSTTIEFRFHPRTVPSVHFVYRYSITGIGTNGANAGIVNANQQGVTGSWFQPATDRQGIELEVFEDLVAPGVGVIQGSWFTFDGAAAGGADHGRWYTFGGAVQAGTNTVSLPLYRNTGGNFNAAPATSPVSVGTVSFTFIDCATARLAYAFTDGRQDPVGSESLVRLTPNVSCMPSHSAPGPSDFGLSGNWYDASKSGQGIVVEVNPLAPAVFLAWYTYALGGESQGASGQRWYTALASYAPGVRSIALQLYETTGGLLNRATPVPSSVQVGTATIAFSSCSAARLTFTFTAGSNAGQVGAVDLARVGPVPVSCVF
jgi:hypothetical protein